MKRVVLFVFLNVLLFGCAAQQIAWQKCLGGQSLDFARSIQQTLDGGFIVAGSTASNDGDVSGNHGADDCWVAKLDSGGFIDWQKCLGGSGLDFANSVLQTADGGYVVAGISGSNDGNVTGNHGGGGDFWIVRLDSNGIIVWQKCLGGSQFDVANSIRQTPDGGYILGGNTQSNDGDVTGNHGASDVWVVKIDGGGNINWQKCLGGTQDERANSIEKTSDGGYVVAGYSESNDGDVSGNHTGGDVWVVKLDSSGIINWQKCLGGTGHEIGYSVQQTSDDGFIVISGSTSDDGDVSGNHGVHDFWVVKLDNSGNIDWQRCHGGTLNESGYSVRQTIDGGYIVVGSTESNDDDVSGNHGFEDVWVLKLDSMGNIMKQRCLGGTADEAANAHQLTPDGGFIVAGRTSSDDGDVSGNHGSLDFWVVKLDSAGSASIFNGAPANNFLLYPNPARNNLTVEAESGIWQVSLHDIAGKQLIYQDFNGHRPRQIEMNISHLAEGLYFVKVQSAQFLAFQRLIKLD